MDQLKEDVRKLYQVTKKLDDIQDESKKLKQKIMDQLTKNNLSKTKFDFEDMKIFMSSTHNTNISRKLLSEILSENYPEINQDQFFDIISVRIRQNKPYNYIKVEKK